MELRDTYQGFSESLGRAFELALTPAIFGLAGYGLDRWLGIFPLLTTLFALLAIVGLVTRMYYSYTARMKELEAAGPWAPTPGHVDRMEQA